MCTQDHLSQGALPVRVLVTPSWRQSQSTGRNASKCKLLPSAPWLCSTPHHSMQLNEYLLSDTFSAFSAVYLTCLSFCLLHCGCCFCFVFYCFVSIYIYIIMFFYCCGFCVCAHVCFLFWSLHFYSFPCCKFIYVIALGNYYVFLVEYLSVVVCWYDANVRL